MGGYAPAPLYRGPILRSAVAIVPFALLAALAALVPLMQCTDGAGTGQCVAATSRQAPVEPATPTGLSATRQANVHTASAAPAATAATAEVVPIAPQPELPAPAPTRLALLEATFDIVSTLPGPVERTTVPTAETAPVLAAQAPPAQTAAVPVTTGSFTRLASPPAEVASRVVTTMPVRLGYVQEPLQSFETAPATAAEAAKHAGNGVVATVAVAAEPETVTAEVGPAADIGQSRQARVSGDYLNVRADAASSSRRLFVLSPGERVEVLSRQRRWIEIADADGRRGWVYADYMADPAGALGMAEPASRRAATVASIETAPAADANALIVDGAGVNVRSAPSMSGDKLFALPAGERVTVSDRRRGWIEITDDRGRVGWSYSDFFYAAGNG